MRKKSPVPLNERKLRRKLRELSDQVHMFIVALDREFQQPTSVERGKRIAHLMNQMEIYNDGARFFWCGVKH